MEKESNNGGKNNRHASEKPSSGKGPGSKNRVDMFREDAGKENSSGEHGGKNNSSHSKQLGKTAGLKSKTSKKRCAVFNCSSNSTKNPEMCFVFVPRNGRQRKVWIAKMKTSFRAQKLYCCELHFNLEEDCADFEDYKQQSGENKKYLKLKKGVLPHKHMPTTSDKDSSPGRAFLEVPMAGGDFDKELSSTSSVADGKEVVDPLQSTISLFRPIRGSVTDEGLEETFISKLPLSTSYILGQPGPSGQSSSWQKEDIQHSASSSTINSKIPSMQSRSTVSYRPSTVTSTCVSSSTDAVADSYQIRRTQLEFTMEAIKSHPERYLGITVESIHVIDILSEATDINIRDIFIILRKLRLNEPHWQLGIQFQLSITSIGRVINENIALLADAVDGFIVWPEIEDVQINLPSSFKHRFGAVNTIIDCFEIQIQKPTNTLHQALTYSMYKKCNTIKYLIACLPDGLINFISKGAGGRISDQEIVRESGFLDKLSENSMVMADRGFKSIEVDLRDRKCSLVRPPSTTATKQMGREEVLLNKRIASVRIHVERAIGRLREFEFLKPHATVESKMINKLDYYVCIACGICNIQPNLIKE